MKVYYVSDIHLELRKDKYRFITPKVPKGLNPTKLDDVIEIMVLAGDIGSPFHQNYVSLIDDCSNTFDHTFVIAGNHEYYTSKSKQHTLEMVDEKIREVCRSYNNVHFLECEKPKIIDVHGEQIKFVGCTLWTLSDGLAESVMNDYKNIYLEDADVDAETTVLLPSGFRNSKTRVKPYRRLLTANDVSYGLHLPMKQYIIDQLEHSKQSNIRTIVVTHHSPSQLMINTQTQSHSSKFGGQADVYSKYYYTNLEHLFVHPLIVWISGHTHTSKSVTINGIQSVSNCFGYPTQNAKDTGYSEESFIDIKIGSTPQ